MVRLAWSAAQAPLLHPQRIVRKRGESRAMPDRSGQVRPRSTCGVPIAIAFVLAGCTQASPPEPAPAATTPQAHAEARICRPEAALLLPQSPPDCVFRRGDLKTADPELWAKLKIEYERQCYERAERRVREHLARLQAASRCEIEAANR
jgi:hypothetical protein